MIHYECLPGYSTDMTPAKAAGKFFIVCEADGTFSKPPGKTGDSGACENVDDCAVHTCGPFGDCVDKIDGYDCKCMSGYKEVFDEKNKEKVCGNIDDCGPEACGVGKCIDGINDYTCECPSGHKEITTGEEKTCAKITCGIPPKVPNAQTEPFDHREEKIFFGSMVRYVCLFGHTLDGKPNGKNHFSVMCQADKQFNDTIPCRPIECDKPLTYKHSSRSPDPLTFTEKVKYTCDTGHTVDGTAEGDKTFHTTCQATSRYSQGFDCKPVSCGEPKRVANAARPAGALKYGQVVKYKCFNGYTLDGDPDSKAEFSTKCQANGKLDAVIKPCKAKVCGHAPSLINVLHATVHDIGHVTYPNVVKITCRDGFTKDGVKGGPSDFVIKCGANGEFDSHAHFKCAPVQCGKLPSMANATLRKILDSTGKAVQSGVLAYSQKAIYDCKPGFTAGGGFKSIQEVHAECSSAGQFSLPQPDLICRNVNDCAKHTCGAKGKCIDLIGPSPAYTCECQFGFELRTKEDGEKVCGNVDDCGKQGCGPGTCEDLVGDYICHCPGGHYVGELDGEKTCLPVRCKAEAPVIANGALEDGDLEGQPIDYDATVKYKCNEGFSVDGSTNEAKKEFQVACKDTGQLSGLQSCRPIICGTPHSFPFTSLTKPAINTHLTFGKEAEYKCKTGYTITGDTDGATTFKTTCQKTSIMSDPYICEAISCGKPPAIEKSSPLFAGTIRYGGKVRYACKRGYTLTGLPGGVAAFNLGCKLDGTFTHTEEKPCKPVSAGKTPIIANAVLAKYMGYDEKEASVEAFYPHVIEYRCKNGFTDSGSPRGRRKFFARVNAIGKLWPMLPMKCRRIRYKVSGIVKNAKNGRGLNGVKVTVVGKNRQTTARRGFFTLTNVNGGEMKLRYTKSGFITVTRTLQISGDLNVGGAADINMSPVMKFDDWRATLQWGSFPADLDTYVKWNGVSVDWTKKYAKAKNIRVRLEKDDTNGYGPETVYMQGMKSCKGSNYNCDVKYMVHDYTESTDMAIDAGAVVTLYNGNRVAGEWRMDECQNSVSFDGNWFHAFTVDARTNKLKWSCDMGPSSVPMIAGKVANFLLHGTGNLSAETVDYESYVGPFPGRFFRHSQRRANSTHEQQVRQGRLRGKL
jgi:hypothetical protein